MLLGIMVYAFNTSTWNAKAGRFYEFQASLLYIMFQTSQGYAVSCSQNTNKNQGNHNKNNAYIEEKKKISKKWDISGN